MLAIDIEEPLDEVERIVNHSPFSRIPVYEGSIDNIIGVLQLNHFYKRCSTAGILSCATS